MSNNDEIKSYIKALTARLKGLDADERADIAAEIAAHLEYRASEGRLDEAMAALGSPAKCAQGFLDELSIQTAFDQGGPTRTIGALFSLAAKRSLAAFGLFFSGVFLLASIGFLLTGVSELVMPDATGLWRNETGTAFSFGIIDPDMRDNGHSEILGLWYIPVAAALALLCFLLSQWIGRFFLKIMMSKGRRTYTR